MITYSKSSFRAVSAALIMGMSTVASYGETVFGPYGRWIPSVETSLEYSSITIDGETFDTDSSVYSLLSPIAQGNDWLLFTDFRAYNLHPDWNQGNFGLVFRKRWNDAVYGVYSFVDVQDSPFENTFWKGTLGFEVLTDRFDVRLRGTVPFQDTKTAIGASEVSIEGGGLVFNLGEENAMTSAELDVRMRLPVDQVFGDRMSFWMGLDTSVYTHDNIDRQMVYGGRFEARLHDGVFGVNGSRLSLEANLKKAEGLEPAFSGALRVRMPLGRSQNASDDTMDRLDRRMTDRVHHSFFYSVIPDATGPDERLLDDATNVLINQYVELDDQADVTAQNAAVTANNTATENTLFVINGVNGPFAGSLLAGQNRTYVGSGSTVALRSDVTNTVFQFTPDGTAPTFVQGTNTAIVSVQGSNTHIAGLTLQGGGAGNGQNYGFGGLGALGRISNISNVVIEQNTISNTGGDGIGFDQNNSQIVITGNTISNVFGDGIAFEQFNQDILVARNTIDNTGIFGLAMGDNNNQAFVVENSFANTGSAALIMFRNNALDDFSRNTFSGNIAGDLIDIVGTGNVFLTANDNAAGAATVAGDVCGNGTVGTPFAFFGTINLLSSPGGGGPLTLQSGAAPCF